jgi:release factor glutamine methyltransferase
VNLRAALLQARRRLEEAGCETPDLDARVLLGHVTGYDHARLITRDREELGDRAADFEAMLRRREAREPVAYLTGRREFRSLEFEVGPGVLVPRPETELLVERATAFLRDRSGTARVADIGTGSGILAICIAREFPSARIWAVDRSAAALEIARRNAARLRGEGAGVLFSLSNLVDSFAPQTLDLVVSNPPYLSASDLAGAAPELSFEPRVALEGGPDGLDVFRDLARGARRVLRPGGRLLVEIGLEQAKDAQKILLGSGFARAGVLLDLEGRARVVEADPA